MIIVGVMSGSSLDGIDIAAYHIDYDPSTKALNIKLLHGYQTGRSPISSVMVVR